MKKLLLAFLIGASAVSTLRSQTSVYHPLLADTNVWAVYMDVIPILQQAPHNNPQLLQNPGPDYVHKIKDTLVNSMTYTMFYSRTNENNPSQWSLLREDTATQQVYLLSAGDTAERIIYDFSLNAGDSIWLDFSYQGFGRLVSGWWYVDSTNTYAIDAGPRKALYLSNPLNPQHNGQPRFLQWIESVGCNLSPIYLDETTEECISPVEFAMGPGCTQNRHIYSVTCATQNGVQIFSSECWENVRNSMQFQYPNGDTCLFVMMGGVDDHLPGIGNASLAPNPASNSTTLVFNEHHPLIFAITITDVLGQTVRTVSPTTWYAAGQHEVPIDCAGLAPGVYLVNLQGDQGVAISLRMVVQ